MWTGVLMKPHQTSSSPPFCSLSSKTLKLSHLTSSGCTEEVHNNKKCFAKAGKMEPNQLLNGFGPLQPAVALH